MRRVELSLFLAMFAGAAFAQQAAPAAPAPTSDAPAGAPLSHAAIGNPPPSAAAPAVPPAAATPSASAANPALTGTEKTAPATAPAEPGFMPSYGSWEKSLMFPSSAAENMKRILAYYESHKNQPPSAIAAEDNGDALINQLLSSIDEKNVAGGGANGGPPPPPPYPTFRLNSITLEPHVGWVLMLNSQRLRLVDGTASGDVQVTAVTPTSASFLWLPSDKALILEMQKDIVARQKAGNPDPPQPNRVAAPIPNSNISAAANLPISVRFTLRPNQTFAPQYMVIYEGLAPGMRTSIDIERDRRAKSPSYVPRAVPLAPAPVVASPANATPSGAGPNAAAALENLKAANALAAQNATRLDATQAAPSPSAVNAGAATAPSSANNAPSAPSEHLP